MQSLIRLARENKKVTVTVGILLLLLLWTLLRSGPEEAPAPTTQTRGVEIASVLELAQRSTSLPVTGQVESESEAILRAQASGEIIRNTIPRGSQVRAGDIIATIENSSERAALTQANGAVAIAEAQLDRLLRGAREEELTILAATTQTAVQSLDESRTDVYTAVRNVYVTSEDIVRNTIDQMIENPRSNYPKTIFHVADSQLNSDIEDDRFAIEKMFETRTINEWVPIVIVAPAPENLDAEVERAQTRLTATNQLLDNMILAVNRLSPNTDISQTTITTWSASLAAARIKLDAAVTQLSNAMDAVDNPVTSLTIAQENEALSINGARSEDIRISRASLEQAQGVRASALAQFEKTLIRAPISGTLNSLDIELGDIVSNNEVVGFVSNNNTLEIVTYLTSNTVTHISRGNSVTINGVHEGEVAYIAPAIDRTTKKVEARISIKDPNALFNGQSVNLEIARTPVAFDAITEVRIPLAALKISFDSHLVFTLDDEQKLLAHPVTPGPLVGNDIVILEGLTADMEIVTDARGFKEGDTVTVLK